MPVDEVFAAPGVPVSTSLARVTKQRGREPVQSSPLSLEPLSADVDDQPLAAAGRTQVIRLTNVHQGGRRGGGRLGGRRETKGGPRAGAEWWGCAGGFGGGC